VSSTQMLVSPEKVVKIKDKEIFYLLSYYSEDERYKCYCLNLLSNYSEDERYNYYCLKLLSYYSEDKEIFYLLCNLQVSYILINTCWLHIN